MIIERKSSTRPGYLSEKQVEIILFLAPATLFALAIIIYPLFYGIYLSFTHTDSISLQSSFVGLKNYAKLLKDEVFWISLRTTFIYAFSCILIELPLAFIIAELLNQPIRGRWVYRGLLLLPWVMPSIAAAVLWGWIFSGDYGLINYYLGKMGIIHSNIGWLADGNLALPAIIIIQVWKGLPWTTVVLLAGLQTIPKEMFEAAQIDGASPLQQIWYITIQFLRPVLVIASALRFAWIFNTFDMVYILTSGGPGYSTYLLSIYTYLTSFSFQNIGYGSALAVSMLLILLAISVIFIRTVSRKEI